MNFHNPAQQWRRQAGKTKVLAVLSGVFLFFVVVAGVFLGLVLFGDGVDPLDIVVVLFLMILVLAAFWQLMINILLARHPGPGLRIDPMGFEAAALVPTGPITWSNVRSIEVHGARRMVRVHLHQPQRNAPAATRWAYLSPRRRFDIDPLALEGNPTELPELFAYHHQAAGTRR